MGMFKYGKGSRNAIGNLYEVAKSANDPDSKSSEDQKIKAMEAVAAYQGFDRAIDIQGDWFAKSPALKAMADANLEALGKAAPGVLGAVLAEAMDEAITNRKAGLIDYLWSKGAPKKPALAMEGRTKGWSMSMSRPRDWIASQSWCAMAASASSLEALAQLARLGVDAEERNWLSEKIKEAKPSEKNAWIQTLMVAHPWIASLSLDSIELLDGKKRAMAESIELAWRPKTARERDWLSEALAESAICSTWAPMALNKMTVDAKPWNKKMIGHWRESFESAIGGVDFNLIPKDIVVSKLLMEASMACSGPSYADAFESALKEYVGYIDEKHWELLPGAAEVISNMNVLGDAMGLYLNGDVASKWVSLISIAAAASSGDGLAKGGRAAGIKKTLALLDKYRNPILVPKSKGPRRV